MFARHPQEIKAHPMSKGTTHRGIRMDDELWLEFKAATKAAGLNASEVIRQLVRDWLNTNKGEK